MVQLFFPLPMTVQQTRGFGMRAFGIKVESGRIILTQFILGANRNRTMCGDTVPEQRVGRDAVGLDGFQCLSAWAVQTCCTSDWTSDRSFILALPGSRADTALSSAVC